MIEIRFHGRGGQGAVVASSLLAAACFREGKHVQSFPLFGFERRGAPVMAFTRLSDAPIVVRSQIYEPDLVIVLDPSLVRIVNVTAGLKDGGWIVVNSEHAPGDLGFPRSFRVAAVDATAVALRHHLGSRASPIVNTAILGAAAKATGIASLDAVLAAIAQDVPTKREENAAAAAAAWDAVRVG